MEKHVLRCDRAVARVMRLPALLALIGLAISGCTGHHRHGLLPEPAQVDGHEIALAQAMLAAGAPEQALAVLNKARASDDPAFHALKGRSALLAGHTAFAERHLLIAARLGSDDWRVYSALGVLRARAGDDEAALAYFTQAELASPNQPAVLSNAAMVHLRRDEPEKAIALLRRAMTHPLNNHPQIARNLQAAHAQLAQSGNPLPPRRLADARSLPASHSEILLSAGMRDIIH